MENKVQRGQLSEMNTKLFKNHFANRKRGIGGRMILLFILLVIVPFFASSIVTALAFQTYMTGRIGDTTADSMSLLAGQISDSLERYEEDSMFLYYNGYIDYLGTGSLDTWRKNRLESAINTICSMDSKIHSVYLISDGTVLSGGSTYSTIYEIMEPYQEEIKAAGGAPRWYPTNRLLGNELQNKYILARSLNSETKKNVGILYMVLDDRIVTEPFEKLQADYAQQYLTDGDGQILYTSSADSEISDTLDISVIFWGQQQNVRSKKTRRFGMIKAELYATAGKGGMRRDTLLSRPDAGEENQVLNIYEDVKFQRMEGFGGAVTDAAGYIFSQMTTEQQNRMLQMYFGEMNYAKARVHMDSCDFCTCMYEADPDETDEDLRNFSFADTEKYILPLLDAAEKAAGRKLSLMLTPWSPPAYMKTNGERKHGGTLKKEYRKRWAEYICRYILEFKRRGYAVERISVQNEPKAVQPWDSCVFTAQEEKEFLRDFLYPALKSHGLEDIEVFIWDHNKERLYERAREIIDAETDPMVSGVAFHWYSGDHFEALDLVHGRFPSKKMILSESCLEFGKYQKDEQQENAQRLAHDMIGNLNGGICAFYDWNILLDSEGGPNHCGNFCDAPYLYDTAGKTLEERLCCRYYWHFAHFIRPGAVRLGITRYTDKLDFTVWENADHTKVFVLLNRGPKELPVRIRINGELLAFGAAPHSIISGVLGDC